MSKCTKLYIQICIIIALYVKRCFSKNIVTVPFMQIINGEASVVTRIPVLAVMRCGLEMAGGAAP